MDVTANRLRNLLFLSMFALHVNSYVVKTIPEDQEYAENLFLNPAQQSKDPKTCFRKDLRRNTSVCDIPAKVFFEICKEVVECENIRSLFTSFHLDFDQIPEPCENYTVRIVRLKTSQTSRRVRARQCPTIIGGHQLWVSQGHELGSIFVFSTNHISDDDLRVEDYIVFLDTDDPPES